MAGTDVERVIDQPLAPGLLNDRELRSLRAQAEAASKTGLVPKALQNKPDDVLLVCLTGREMGFRGPMAALAHLYPIEGRICPSAQTMAGLAERAGHELWVEERTSEKCVVAGCRRGSKRVQRVEYTLDDARRAGLLDRWVEKRFQAKGDKWERLHKYVVGTDLGFDDEKVKKAPEWAKPLIGDGAVKQKDNWAKYPAEMLQARALSALCRMAFSDALLGLEPMTPEEMGEDVDLDLEPDTHTESVRPADYHDEPARGDDVDVMGRDLEDDEIIDGELVEDSGGGDSEEAEEADASASAVAGSPSGAPAGEPPEEDEQENAYARAVHILATELGLSAEALDACIHDVTSDVSANSIDRSNWSAVVERMRQEAGKAA